jgi:NAD(P)-dependent dehydrogenase (short-subunit alcohol dehydrogenase family)
MNYNPFSLQGKTILVTGASSGIGKATAIECSKMGAKLVITGRNTERLQETFKQLEGGDHIQIQANLTNSNEISTLIEQIPPIDGVVNNAGIIKTVLNSFITINALQEVLDINTIAPIMLIQMLLKQKKIKKDSSIVFTSSISGVYVAAIGNSLYSTSKGAIDGFVKNAALELASKKIRVNSVNPGMIKTAILDEGVISQEDLVEDAKKYPLKRHGNPEEVAYAAIYLLSDAAAWVTGTNLKIDGGYTLL